jgi:hypothetical protein
LRLVNGERLSKSFSDSESRSPFVGNYIIFTTDFEVCRLTFLTKNLPAASLPDWQGLPAAGGKAGLG